MGFEHGEVAMELANFHVLDHGELMVNRVVGLLFVMQVATPM